MKKSILKYARQLLHTRSQWKPAVAVLLVTVACVALIPSNRETIQMLYESLAYSIDPTPERAYRYGVRHFDAINAHAYDLARAESYFRQVLSLDGTYPNANHHLARIAFLEGNFALALYRINREINTNPDVSPSSYYVRGLIKGFAGDYDSAVLDYQIYLESDPTNWAAINDYAWVLLKAERYAEAFAAVEKGLEVWPNNPWLLNSAAIALYELKDERAREYVDRAAEFVDEISDKEWVIAYPGNDPLIAPEGVQALRDSVIHNRTRIETSEEL